MKRSVLIKKARVSPAPEIDLDYVTSAAAEVLPKKNKITNRELFSLEILWKSFI